MYEIVKSEGNERTVRFTETAERVNELFDKIRKQISKDLDLPGFRPGKIPKSIIDKRYGNIIKAEVADTIRHELTSKLLDEQDWILDDSENRGDQEMPVEDSPYSFHLTFSLFETPEPSELDDITVEVPLPDLEKEVDEALDSLREKMISFETVNRPSESGDLVVLEVVREGTNEAPQEFSIRVGESHLGPGFDDLVSGVEAGHTFSARMRDREDGENPIHHFRVKEVKRPLLPELNDEFAEKVAGLKSMEELRSELEKAAENRHRQEVDYLKKRALIDKLLETNPFDPPKYMVDNLTRDYLNRLGEETPGENTVSAARELARDKVREFLILRAFAEKENIQVSREEVEKEKDPAESAASVADRLRNAKVMELLLGKVNIVEKKKDDGKTGSDGEDSPSSSWEWEPVNREASCGEDGGPGDEGEA